VKFRNIQHRSNWLKKPVASYQYSHWLIDKGSLTSRLQQRYTRFSVKPVCLKYGKPLQDEARVLKHSPYQHALIREVLLLGNDQPVVFAHSVLPSTSLRGPWNKLGRLGNKPLGAALFANPKVKRTPLEYKKLPRHHPISIRVAEHVSIKQKVLWARRSVFSLNCARIFVTEVFLEQLLK